MFEKLNKPSMPLARLALVSGILLSGCTGEETGSSSTAASGSSNPANGGGGAATTDTGSSTGAAGDETSLPLEDTSHFYFSYDDSASTASRDLTLFYLDQGLLPNASWGRAYEYLNAETFGAFSPQKVGPFDLSVGAYSSSAAELMIDSELENVAALGVNVVGPSLSQEERPNLVLTLLVDTSGSMSSDFHTGIFESIDGVRTRMELVRYGIDKLRFSLKPGDEINLVEFNNEAQVLLEGWEYSTAGTSVHQDTLALYNESQKLAADGSTNLDAGITLAYQVANRTYDQHKANRVIMLTDAYANTGQTDTSVIANNLTINGMEGIYFSGIGIGSGFNEGFLNELTDIGKGTYSALVTPADATRLFGDGFMRFVEVAVENVRFHLDFPATWRSVVSAAEESSTNQSNVQTVNYSYNNEQFFFEAFSSDLPIPTTDEVTLTVSWTDTDGEDQQDSLTLVLGNILGAGEDRIQAAAAVVGLAKLVSGTVNCGQIDNSGLLELPNDHEVFKAYTAAIDQYCKLKDDDSAIPAVE